VAVTTVSDKIAFIESVFGTCKVARNSKNVEVRCPVCAPRDPTKKKLAIRVDDDRNHCWTCGWRAHTLAPLLRKFSSPDKLNEYRARFMSDDERKRSFRLDDKEAEKKLTLPGDFRMLAPGSWDPDSLAAYRYLVDRGLSSRDMWFFKVGVSDDRRWHRRVIVPSFDKNGELNYFVARAIDRLRKPKYDNPDHDKLPVIFNEIHVDWTKRLVICEGVFDMFKCGDNVVPLLGSDLNERSALFNSILVNGTPVAVALDSDMWETKTLRAAKKLAEYDIDVTIVDTRQFGDPGSTTKEQFQIALSGAKGFDWRSTVQTRLGRSSRISLSI